MEYEDDDRYATQRGRYLSRTTELRKPEAKAVAYSELGYSSNGIAKKLDTGESTVEGYLEKAIARYGFEICEFVFTGEEELPDYDPVDPDYFQDRPAKTDRKKWVDMVERYGDKLPADWVNDVLDTAEDARVRPRLKDEERLVK